MKQLVEDFWAAVAEVTVVPVTEVAADAVVMADSLEIDFKCITLKEI